MLDPVVVGVLLLLALVAVGALLVTRRGSGTKSLDGRTRVDAGGELPNPRQEPPDTVSPTGLVLGDPADPLVLIRSTDAFDQGPREVVPLSDPLRRQLDVLLETPKIALRVANCKTTRLILEFSPKVSEQLLNGSATLVPSAEGGYRAIARSVETGRFVGHGSIQAVTQVNPTLVAAAVWQIAAVATAQKFLADIDRRLAHIEEGIRALQDWVEHRRRSRLEANLIYLQSIAGVLQRGSLTEVDAHTFSNQIESIERECLEVMREIRLEIDKPFQGLEQQKMRALRPGKVIEEFGNHLDQFERLIVPLYLALFVRAVAAQLRTALPVDHSLSQLRLQQLQKEHAELAERQTKFFLRAKGRISDLDGILAVKSKDAKYQNTLSHNIWKVERQIDRPALQTGETLKAIEAHVHQALAAPASPLCLAVELGEQGQLVEVSRPTALPAG